MKVLIYLILVLIGGKSLGTDIQEISGIVLSAKDNTPLPYCQIIHTESKTVTYSDLEGKFRMSFPVYKDYLVQVSCVGYQSAQVDVKNHEGQFKLYLKPSVLMLKEVVITPLNNDPVMLVKHGLKELQKHYAEGPFTAKILGRHIHSKGGEIASQLEDVVDYFPMGRSWESFNKREIFGKLYYRLLYENKKKELGDVGLKPDALVSWFYFHLLSIHKNEKLNPGFFSELDFLSDYSNYAYNVEKVIDKEPNSVFVISFFPKKNSIGQWQGNIYVECNTWAIIRVECDYKEWKNYYNDTELIKESFLCEYFKLNEEYYPLRGSYVENIRLKDVPENNDVIRYSRYWEVLNVMNNTTINTDLDDTIKEGVYYTNLKDYQKKVAEMKGYRESTPLIKSYF